MKIPNVIARWDWSFSRNKRDESRANRLRAAGFLIYPLNEISDAALARELLAILHDVYGYRGKPQLKISTEQGGS